MKRFLFFALSGTVIIMFSFTATLAQTQYTGCLYNSRLYYDDDGSSGGYPNYKTNPSITLSSAFCVETTSDICRVNKKSYQQGTLRTFYMVQCPIDDYIMLMLLATSGLGFLMIRRSKIT